MKNRLFLIFIGLLLIPLTIALFLFSCSGKVGGMPSYVEGGYSESILGGAPKHTLNIKVDNKTPEYVSVNYVYSTNVTYRVHNPSQGIYVIERDIYYPVPREFRLFEDIEEFKSWYEAIEYKIKFGDCDDIGEWLTYLAARDGYLLSYQYVDADGYINFKRVNDYSYGAHMGILVMTYKDIYYFEPEFETIIFITPRD